MPNIKSVKKDVLRSRIANERNRAARSILKTTMKKFDAALLSGNASEIDSAYIAAVMMIDRSVKKGIIHKNNAARKKSSITLKKNAAA